MTQKEWFELEIDLKDSTEKTVHYMNCTCVEISTIQRISVIYTLWHKSCVL